MISRNRVRHRAEVREVYFIRAERSGMVKIGVANDADKRLAALQSANPERLTLLGIAVSGAAEALEESLHLSLANEREHGEWFRPTEPTLRAVRAHALHPRFARFQHSRNEMLRAGKMTALQVAQSLERHPNCPRIAA